MFWVSIWNRADNALFLIAHRSFILPARLARTPTRPATYEIASTDEQGRPNPKLKCDLHAKRYGEAGKRKL